MLNIVRNAFKAPTVKAFTNSLRQGESGLTKRQFTRTLWHMCSTVKEDSVSKHALKLTQPTNLCSCGCGTRKAHTKGEKELADFLTEEIAAERKLLKSPTIPSEVDGFNVKLDGSEVTLTKTVGDEAIEVNFNINHSVDSESEPEISPANIEKGEYGQMKSKPVFEIEIRRGNKTLGFTCSFINPGETTSEDGYNDIFSIDEVTLYEGPWKDSNYAVSGEVLDGYLYDLLMNILDDKGITNEFVEKLSDFSTIYEHNSYISLLEGLKKFSSGH